MTSIMTLWLPILLSAIAVFVLSAIIHMGPLWHKNDYPKVPNEDSIRNALAPLAIPPGDYMIPRPEGRDEMKSPEFAEKMRTGPNLIMTVLPTGPFSMTSNFVQWFLYLILVGMFAAWVAGLVLPAGADSYLVFHFVTITAFIGYSLALWQMSIWYHRSWSTTLKTTFDGLLYALVTGAVFCWLWP